jgi:hypothetical protein
MGKKFAITPDIESWVIDRFNPYGITTIIVASARAEAARYTVCSEKKLIHAIACGSLHAIDYAPFFTDNENNRGGAIRWAFNPNTVAAWAKDDAAIIAAHRLERVAILNANKTSVDSTACGAGTCMVKK